MKDIKDYMRVTDILFPFSGLKEIDPVILKRAADRGTRVHAVCDAIIEGMGVPEIDEDIKGYVESFNKWLDSPLFKLFMPNPGRFFDDSLKITGECDAIYCDHGHFSLVDFKTPLKEGKTWGMQGAAYKYLAQLNPEIEIDQIEFVKLDKFGAEPIVYTYDFRDNFDDFLLCLECYKKFFLKTSEESYLDYL